MKTNQQKSLKIYKTNTNRIKDHKHTTTEDIKHTKK